MHIIITLNIREELQIDLYKVRDALCYIEPHNQYVEKIGHSKLYIFLKEFQIIFLF